jgi:hypothetical protein
MGGKRPRFGALKAELGFGEEKAAVVVGGEGEGGGGHGGEWLPGLAAARCWRVCV